MSVATTWRWSGLALLALGPCQTDVLTLHIRIRVAGGWDSESLPPLNLRKLLISRFFRFFKSYGSVAARYKDSCVGVCLMASPTTLVGFAERHSLRVRHDECHDAIVPGKLGHLYQREWHSLGAVNAVTYS